MIIYDQIKRDLKNIGLDEDEVNKKTEFIIGEKINMDINEYYDYLFKIREKHYKYVNKRNALLGIVLAFLIILAIVVI